NSTAVHVEFVTQNKTTGRSSNTNEDLTLFPSTDAARSYLDSHKSNYTLASTVYPATGGAYSRVTGHAPSVYREYQKATYEGYYHIKQLDNLVSSRTDKALY
ncbi:MAG: hypothetical protein ACXV49_09985, partial [Halobacteriota archaeon]